MRQMAGARNRWLHHRFIHPLFGCVGVIYLAVFLYIPVAAKDPEAPIQQEPAPVTYWLPQIFHDYAPATLASPNGQLRLTFSLQREATGSTIAYAVTYKGQPLLNRSTLGLQVVETETPLGELGMTGLAFTTVDETYTLPFGEETALRDHYQQMIVTLQEVTPPYRQIELHFRAYDAGVALRYAIPAQSAWPLVRLIGEQTHFAFPSDPLAYVEYGMEGSYQPQPVSAMTGQSENPLTLVHNNGIITAITEAQVDNYPRMRLSRADAPQTLVTVLAGPAAATTPYQTPWRLMLVAESAADLLANNELLYHLSAPSILTDTLWIQPGKAMRIMGLNTQSALETIDFAAAHGIEYVEFDAGWYGLGDLGEFDPSLDATRAIDAIDLPQVLAYAAQKGRGVLLYVNRVALTQQLDTLLPRYAEWGVKGVKFGFMDGETQPGINFIHQAVRKAATYQLIVDVHDSYRPSGMSRTYPNLLTQEGLRGNEHFSGADHHVILPFTRFLAGAGDYTFPYYDDRLNVTRAHQLAAQIVFFSPLQFVFWYDQPGDYQGEPEIALLDALPTVWDETVVVEGQIGSSVIVARRKGEEWFVGALTNTTGRAVALPLRFLDPTKLYRATSYLDQTPIKVAITNTTVTSSDTLTATLLPSGGYAVQLVPLLPLPLGQEKEATP